MKKFTFKGVLDGFRSSVQTTQQRGDREIEETLRPGDFTLKKVRKNKTFHINTRLLWKKKFH